MDTRTDHGFTWSKVYKLELKRHPPSLAFLHLRALLICKPKPKPSYYQCTLLFMSFNSIGLRCELLLEDA